MEQNISSPYSRTVHFMISTPSERCHFDVDLGSLGHIRLAVTLLSAATFFPPSKNWLVASEARLAPQSTFDSTAKLASQDGELSRSGTFFLYYLLYTLQGIS